MPIEYEIDADKHLVHCRASGTLTNRELIDHYRSIATDPAFDPHFDQLADLGPVERFDLDATTIRREALETVFDASARRAIVAPTDVGFGLARIYGSYAELAPQTVRVFRDMSDARRWLGIIDTV